MREIYRVKEKSIFDMPVASSYKIINASIYYFKWNSFRACMSVRTSHGLWVFFGLSRGNMQIISWCFSLIFFSHNILQEIISVKMGGEAKKLEPEKCHY